MLAHCLFTINVAIIIDVLICVFNYSVLDTEAGQFDS